MRRLPARTPLAPPPAAPCFQRAFAGALLLLALTGVTACKGSPPAPEPPPPTLALAPAWRLLEPYAFEAFAAELVPEGRRIAFDADAEEELVDALGDSPALAVRAAVLLGRNWAPATNGLLLERLEERVDHEQRSADAGDVVAAAALGDARRYLDEDAQANATKRLASLADGGSPHPDLEVRVECAASALVLGDESVVPFLLQVLRLGTWAGQADELDFEPSTTTAWVRGRAAVVLSVAAGVPVSYDTEASVAAREAEAARLAGLLRDQP